MGRALVALGLLASSMVSLPGVAGATEYPVYCQASVHFGNPEGTEFVFHARTAGGHWPYTYHWDFGDGQTGAAADVSHEYAQPGYYVITLTVSDANEPASECADTVLVEYQIVSDPICIASADSVWGAAPLTITFHAGPAFLATDSYVWSFGDGATSTLQHPTHTFENPGTYWVHVLGSETGYPGYFYECRQVHRVTVVPAGLLGVGNPVPHGVALRPARPNPFVASTSLSFDLPRSGNVLLRVFDASGRLVTTLIDGPRTAGTQSATWNGRCDDSRPGAAGIYFAALEYEGATQTIRLVRMR